ncbi:MAG: MlaE family ABC transporter permease [Desulfobacca sp.]|uniref:MlaE family ABC transporter permease n=1 Tax=Desulfobacca sp. TaxID=2067990 RepID=UPI00404A1674
MARTSPLVDPLRFFAAFWRAALALGASFLSISALFYRLLTTFGQPFGSHRLMLREYARQIYRLGFRGWPIVALAGLLLGLSIIVYIAAQLRKIQLEELIGTLLVIVVVRELGPILTALLVLLRSGAAMIVEIGIMKLDREMESLELMGLETEIVIGAPRFWGLLLSLIILFGIFVFSAIIGGYLFGQLLTDIYWQKLWRSFLNALNWQDVIISTGKIVLFALSMGCIAIYYGLGTKDYWESLAVQTSRGAVAALIALGLLNTLLSILNYLV